MKLSIPKDQLVKAIERCDVVADPQSSHPHTGKVLLTASGTGKQQVLQAYATDLKIQIDTAVAALAEEHGSVAVDCSRLLAVTKAMPTGTIKLRVKNEKQLLVSCSGSRQYTLPTIPASTFPRPNEPQESAQRITIPAQALSKLIERVQHSISPDGRPHMDGVFLDYDDGKLSAVAGVAHTISVASWKGGNPKQEQWQSIVPSFALKAVLGMCSGSKDITLGLDGPVLYYETQDTLIGSLLPRDPFFNWRDGMRGLSRTPVAKVHALDVLDVLKAIAAARQEKTSPVRLVLRQDVLEIALVGEECKAVDRVMVEPLEKTDFRALVNPRYLNDLVKGADGDFTLEDANGPVLISTNDFLGLVSPINPEAWPGAFD